MRPNSQIRPVQPRALMRPKAILARASAKGGRERDATQ